MAAFAHPYWHPHPSPPQHPNLCPCPQGHQRLQQSPESLPMPTRTPAPPAEPEPAPCPRRPGPDWAPLLRPAPGPAAPRRPHQRASRPRVRAGWPGPAAALPRPLPGSSVLRAPQRPRPRPTAASRPSRAGTAPAQRSEAGAGLHGAPPPQFGLCREVLPVELDSQIDGRLVSGM